MGLRFRGFHAEAVWICGPERAESEAWSGSAASGSWARLPIMWGYYITHGSRLYSLFFVGNAEYGLAGQAQDFPYGFTPLFVQILKGFVQHEQAAFFQPEQQAGQLHALDLAAGEPWARPVQQPVCQGGEPELFQNGVHPGLGGIQIADAHVLPDSAGEEMGKLLDIADRTPPVCKV